MLLNHNSSFVFPPSGPQAMAEIGDVSFGTVYASQTCPKITTLWIFKKGDGIDRKWHPTKQSHWYWIQKTSQDGIGFQLLHRKALFLSRVFSGEAGWLFWPHATFRWEHRSSHVLGRQKAVLFTFLHHLGNLYCHDTVPEKLEVTGVARVTGVIGVGIFDISRATLYTEF